MDTDVASTRYVAMYSNPIMLFWSLLSTQYIVVEDPLVKAIFSWHAESDLFAGQQVVLAGLISSTYSDAHLESKIHETLVEVSILTQKFEVDGEWEGSSRKELSGWIVRGPWHVEILGRIRMFI